MLHNCFNSMKGESELLGQLPSCNLPRNVSSTCALALNVPAMGCPIAEHDPIRIILSLKLCDKCLSETKPSDFFAADLNGNLEQIVRIQARGKAEPDFKRAFVTRVNFEDSDYKILTANRSK